MEENNNNVENSSELQSEVQEAGAGAEENTEDKKKKTLGREILEWTEAIVLAVVIAFVIRSFIFTVVRVDGQSMDHTLANNDRLIVWRLGYEPKQGDIVIFAPPIPENEGRNSLNRIYWVKRVIATGGQHVDIDYSENAVYVDGKKLNEDYLPQVMERPGGNTIESVDIPEGDVFLMGDNRNNSRDCRYIGPVDEDTVIGKAVFRFWPLTSAGTVTHVDHSK